jgi:hypothetical protein
MRLDPRRFRITRPVALSIVAVVVLACVEGGRSDPSEPRAEPGSDRTLAAIALSAVPSMWWEAGTFGDETTLASASVTIELAVDAAPPRDAGVPNDAAPPIDAPPPIDAGPPPDALLTRDAAPRR